MELRFLTGYLFSGANRHGCDPGHALLPSNGTGIYLGRTHYTGRGTGVNDPVPPCQHCEFIFCVCLYPCCPRFVLWLIQKSAGRALVGRGRTVGFYDPHRIFRILSSYGADEPVRCDGDH